MNVTTLFLILVINFGFAQIPGCTDINAKNYNSQATINDGSCQYNDVKIKPVFSQELDNSIHETSGLIHWNDKLWTINDDKDVHLYSFDSIGKNIQKQLLPNVKNKDWEEISQDSLHIYIGDFGNNVSGNRKDLQILKIQKKSILDNNPVIDTISFVFEDQNNFENKKANTTNFDCESLIVTRDSLYLFTKEWKSKQTRLYVLPKFAGNHRAKYKATLNVKGLITGAFLYENSKIVVLSGYSKKLKPFLYLLYDYKENHFFSGNKRKIKLALPFHQIEGIASENGLQYYLTNEQFKLKPFISVNQKLHLVDLKPYLKFYVNKNARNN